MEHRMKNKSSRNTNQHKRNETQFNLDETRTTANHSRCISCCRPDLREERDELPPAHSTVPAGSILLPRADRRGLGVSRRCRSRRDAKRSASGSCPGAQLQKPQALGARASGLEVTGFQPRARLARTGCTCGRQGRERLGRRLVKGEQDCR